MIVEQKHYMCTHNLPSKSKRLFLFVFLSTWLYPDQNCTLPLVKNGKIGNTTGQEWENRKYKLFDQKPKYSWKYAHCLNEDNICTK